MGCSSVVAARATAPPSQCDEAKKVTHDIPSMPIDSMTKVPKELASELEFAASLCQCSGQHVAIQDSSGKKRLRRRVDVGPRPSFGLPAPLQVGDFVRVTGAVILMDQDGKHQEMDSSSLGKTGRIVKDYRGQIFQVGGIGMQWFHEVELERLPDPQPSCETLLESLDEDVRKKSHAEFPSQDSDTVVPSSGAWLTEETHSTATDESGCVSV